MRRKRQNYKKKLILALLLVFFLAIIFLLYQASKTIISILPTINLSKNEKIISPIDNDHGIDSLKQRIQDKNLKISTLKISTESGILVGEIKNGPTVYFSTSKSAESQASSLQLILSRLTIDNNKPTFIDLRFAKPIVKF